MRRTRVAGLAVFVAIALAVAIVQPAGLPFGGPFEDHVRPPSVPRDPPPAPEVDVLVAVDADGSIRPIDPRLYSSNVAGWAYPRDYEPEPNATFVAMVKQIRPALLRFPAGHWSQSTYFDPTNTVKSPPPGFKHVLTGAELDAFVATARAVGAEPLIGVNLKSGSPEMAAAMVRYANVERGHGVTWFELGNEPDLEYGRDTSPAIEAEKFHRFAGAMRAVDPNVQLVGGAFMTGMHLTGGHGARDWMTPFAERVGSSADGYSWHWYPLDSDNRKPQSSAHPTVEHLLQPEAGDWPPSGIGFADTACERMERIRALTGAEHWITELGPDSGAHQAPGITDGQAAAVWIADVLPRLAECGADAVFQFALRQQRSSHLILMRHDHTPTPMWASYQLLAQNYRGTALPTDYDARDGAFAAHAARTEEGDLVVVLVNKGAESLTTAVRWGGAYPEACSSWTVEADDPTATWNRVNGDRFTQATAIAGPAPASCDPWGAVEVPAYGVVVLRAS